MNAFIGLAVFAAVILVPVGAFWLSLVVPEWIDDRRARKGGAR